MKSHMINLQSFPAWIVVCLLGFVSMDAVATDALYTNAATGVTITLSQNISVDASLTNATPKAGISFGDGTGDGVVAGDGSLTVRNISTTNQSGPTTLFGIEANTLTNQATGLLTLLNDHSAFSTNSGSASADVVGILGVVSGDIRQSISATARGGTINSTNIINYADAYTSGLFGTIIGSLSSTVTATADGGVASSTGDAYANAVANGIAGQVISNVTGTIEITANGGTAVSTNDQSSATANSYGIRGPVGGNLTGRITSTATGGSASSPNARATAMASAYGVGEPFTPVMIGGHLSGSVEVTATGGIASTSNSTALATAEALGIMGPVFSNLTGTVTTAAEGGTASSSNSTALADAVALGVLDPVFGNLSGVVRATATGGSATGGGGIVNASSMANGVDGLIGGNLSGRVEVTSTGGTASSPNVMVDGVARAFGVGNSFMGGIVMGNLDGVLEITATGGEVVSSNSSAIAVGHASGVVGFINGSLSGSVEVSATGGTASSSNNIAEASGIAYGVGDRFFIGLVGGDLSGSVDVIAAGGAASSSNGIADATALAFGINGLVSSNLSGEVSITATGGTASSSVNMATNTAAAYGITGIISNNLSGSVVVVANGGSALSSSDNAYAQVDILAVTNVLGDVSGSIVATATGKTATGNYADASADATGAWNVGGTVSGSITATARSGIASAINSNATTYTSASGVYDVDTVSGSIKASATADNATSVSGYAIGKAYASGVGDVSSLLGGSVTAMAMAATASSSNGYADASTEVYGAGSVSGLLSGRVRVEGRSGKATTIAGGAYAPTQVGGVGSVNGDLTGRIDVLAVGGTAEGTGPAATNVLATTVAGGILSDNTSISNFNGIITATAVAGLEIPAGTTNLSQTVALGISAVDELYLNASGGSIAAQILVPAGFSHGDLSTNSFAEAIRGGASNDTVLLSGGVSLTGNINLNEGVNTLTILGDASIDGDIYSTGGALDFFVDTGVLTVRGPTTVSDLTGSFIVSSNAGLGFLLTARETNTMLTVEGSMIADNCTLSAAPAPGQSGAGIIGKAFKVIYATNGITGKFNEALESLFVIDITSTYDSVWVTPKSLRFQDTPAPSAILVSVGAVNTVMDNLSVHTGTSRLLLKGKQNPETAGTRWQPLGVAGPSNNVSRLRAGEWTAFVRQFNDLGGLDDDGAISGYDWTTHGFLLGAEKLSKENLLLGVAAGGAWTDLDGNRDSGGGSSDLLTVSAYCNYFTDSWYTEFGLNYGHTWNEAQRVDTLRNSYTGEYDSNIIGIWLEGGYALAINESWEMEPYGRLSYMNGQHDGYTETGVIPMTVNDVTTDNLVTEFGIRGNHQWELKSGSAIQLGLRAGWQFEHLDSEVTVNTSLLGINQQARSPEADASAFLVGLNGDWYLSDVWIIGLDYKPTFSGNWSNHAINGVLRYRF